MALNERAWLGLQVLAALLAIAAAVLTAIVIAKALEPDATDGNISGVSTALIVVGVVLALVLAPLASKWYKGRKVPDRKGMARAVMADPDPDL